MRKKLFILGFFSAFVLVALYWFFLHTKPAETKKTLRVMTYSSFAGVFGPGEEIKKAFEKTCACRVKWIKVADSTLFAQRLSLKKDGFKTDVVLGLDQLSRESVRGLPWKPFKPINDPVFLSPADHFVSPEFIPYNWSPMSFLSREPKAPVSSLQDLLKPSFQHNISLPSPRNSTVGLQFYYWIWSVFREKTAEFLKAFKSQLYGLPPSWSTSYALFQRGHVDLSFSYLSSLLYHRQTQQKDFYFLMFQEGLAFQVEMAGVSGFCTECALAESFVLFLLEPEIQQILKSRNYMLPVTYSSDHDFPILQNIKLISYQSLTAFLNQKAKRLEEWDQWIKGL